MAARQLEVENQLENQLELVEFDQFRALRALRKWILKSGSHIHVCLKTGFFVMVGPVTVAHDGDGNYNFIPGGDMKKQPQIWGTIDESSPDPKYYELRALYRSAVVHAPCEQRITYQQYSRRQLEQTDQEFERKGLPILRVQVPETGMKPNYEPMLEPMNQEVEIGLTVWITIAQTKIALDVMPEGLLQMQRDAEERINILPIKYNDVTQGARKDQKTYLAVFANLKDHREKTNWDGNYSQPRYLVGAEGIFVGSNVLNYEVQDEEAEDQQPYPHGDDGMGEDDSEGEEDLGDGIDDIINVEVGTPNEPAGNVNGQATKKLKGWAVGLKCVEAQKAREKVVSSQKNSTKKPKGWAVALKSVEAQKTRDKMVSTQNNSANPQTRYRRLSNGSILSISGNGKGNRSGLQQTKEAIGTTDNPGRRNVDESQLDLEKPDEIVGMRNRSAGAISDSSFNTIVSAGALRDVLSVSELMALENSGAMVKTFAKMDGEISDMDGDRENKENKTPGKPLTRSQRNSSDTLSVTAANQSLRASTPRRSNNGNQSGNRGRTTKIPALSPNDNDRESPRRALAIRNSNRIRGLMTTEALVKNYTVEELTTFVEAGNPLCGAHRKVPKEARGEERSPPEHDTNRDTSLQGRSKIGTKGLSKRGRQVPQNKRQKKVDGNDTD